MNKVRLLTHQHKSNQIDQTMRSNSKLCQKYLDAKEKLKKLTPQQTPVTTTVAVDDCLESLEKYMSLEKDIAETEFTLLEIEN